MRQKWRGVESGDWRGKGWGFAMKRRRERKCKVEVAVMLNYRGDREIAYLGMILMKVKMRVSARIERVANRL